MGGYTKMIFILFTFGFVISSYGSIYQEEQDSQEEEKTCPLLFRVLILPDVTMSDIMTIVGNGRGQFGEDLNVSLEGCQGDEDYDKLPKGLHHFM